MYPYISKHHIMCLTYIQFFVSYNSIKLKAGRKDEKEEAAQFFPKTAM